MSSRPGDWNCRTCHHLNFQRRESCQRCSEPKHSSAAAAAGDFAGGFASRGSVGFNTGPDVRPGDWYCSLGNCGAHNFASRSSCFKCGASKDDSNAAADRPRLGGFFSFSGGSGSGGGGGGSRSAWKSGDWICSRAGCNEHNFASRMECFRCNAPKEPGSKPSY